MTIKLPDAITRKMKEYTPFQQLVWQACAAIPKGETRTYQWIAKEIGKPGAVRAVGTALGKNPFAPVIPCHRVVRADGTIGKYSGPGGSQGKRQLLRKEGARLLAGI
jgi:methylated-DNA-[protein]-cysteine S-methyltransferase